MTRLASVPEVKVEFDQFGFVKDYVCPYCGGQVTQSHVDDIGTKWFKCEKCKEFSTKLKSPQRKELEVALQQEDQIRQPATLEELSGVLNSTIKYDEDNKVITFLTMLLTFTEEDQINVSFTAESSTGKSYIPLELAWYFPKKDVIEYAYVSPTAFYHEYGVYLPDPEDTRDIEPEKKHKIIYIDLKGKILIFLDQPHDMLLQRLRPLLSHDRKTLVSKITDRHRKGGLRTKTVMIEGYPTVLFCSARFSMEDQERTRLLMLSPETSTEKIREGILLRIEKESDRQAFQDFMESDPRRSWLRRRVQVISEAGVGYLVIPEELRSKIAEQFFSMHNNLIPRLQRDVNRLLALIKAHALLNLWHRVRVGEFDDTIIVNEDDVAEGFRLYNGISTANEMGLPPEMYDIYVNLEPNIPDDGMTRKEFQILYYQTFHRTIGKKRVEEVLNILQQVGLLMEEPDPLDRRQKRVLVTRRGVFIPEDETSAKNGQKINTPEGVTTPQTNILDNFSSPMNVSGKGCFDCAEFTEEKNRVWAFGTQGYCAYHKDAGLTEQSIMNIVKHGCEGFKVREV